MSATMMRFTEFARENPLATICWLLSCSCLPLGSLSAIQVLNLCRGRSLDHGRPTHSRLLPSSEYCGRSAGMTANYFREHLKAAVDEVVGDHSALRVTRRNGDDFVVIGADDWDAIAETLHLKQVPGLVDSIIE